MSNQVKVSLMDAGVVATNVYNQNIVLGKHEVIFTEYKLVSNDEKDAVVLYGSTKEGQLISVYNNYEVVRTFHKLADDTVIHTDAIKGPFYFWFKHFSELLEIKEPTPPVVLNAILNKEFVLYRTEYLSTKTKKTEHRWDFEEKKATATEKKVLSPI
jgi:hypothetical protein